MEKKLIGIMSGEGKGCCMNLFIGVIGSYAGTFISHLLNIELMGKGYILTLCMCSRGSHRIVDLEETILIEYDNH